MPASSGESIMAAQVDDGEMADGVTAGDDFLLSRRLNELRRKRGMMLVCDLALVADGVGDGDRSSRGDVRFRFRLRRDLDLSASAFARAFSFFVVRKLEEYLSTNK